MCIAKEDILSSKKKRNKLETPQSIIKGEENGFFIVNSPGRQESLKNRPCSQVAFLLLLLRFFSEIVTQYICLCIQPCLVFLPNMQTKNYDQFRNC